MLRCFAGPCPCHHRPLAPPRVTAIMQRELAGTSHILYAFPSALPRMALHPTTWSYGDPRIPIIGPNSGRWRHTSSVTTECRTLGQSSSATSPCRTSSSNAGAGSTISVSSSKLHGCRTAAAATAAVVHTAAGVSAAAAVSPSVHPSEAETLLPALSVPTRWRYCRTRRHSCSTSAGSSSGSSSRSRGRSHKTFHPRVLMCAAADSTVASSTVVNDGAGDGGSSSSDSSSSSSAVAGFCGAQPNNASLQDLSSNCIDKEASMSTPNSPPHDTRPDADEIAHRIAASRSRRATRLSYNCPACSISAATPVNISRHMARCCPDLMTPDGAAWAQLASLARGLPSPQHDTVVALLRAAGTREQELRRRVLACVFWSGPLDPLTGLPERLNVEEAAQRLGLPLTRTAAVLQRAMAAVPLASDPAGPPLDVIFEDDHFLAVNKPVGLHTAPIHRFAGGSVVNQVIAYLNRGRGPKYGGDGPQVTLLTPPPDGLPPYASFVPELMPVPEPFTLMTTATSASSSAPAAAAAAVSYSDDITRNCTAAPYQLEPYVLHRLDMNTSGLLLFAKRQEVVAEMHRQFRERTLSKLYVAATVGRPGLRGESADDEGSSSSSSSSTTSNGRFHFRVDAPIDRHPAHAVARVVASTGKEASTSFAVLATNPHVDLGPTAGGTPGMLFHEMCGLGTSASFTPVEHRGAGGGGSSGGMAVATERSSPGALATVPSGASLVLCAPHTGRTHQIRVHLHHVGHPIVGDDIYGVMGHWIKRQALHAAALRFTHPLTGLPVRLTAPLHDDMAACLQALGLPHPDESVLAEVEDEWGRRGTAGAGAGGGGRGGRGRKGSRQC